MCEAIIPASSIRPMPKPSTPMLLLMVCRPLTPFRTSAAIRFSGMPHSPKPPIITVGPSGMSATAASDVAITLFMHSYRIVDDQLGFGGLLDFVDSQVRGDFLEQQALGCDPNNSHLRNDQ